MDKWAHGLGKKILSDCLLADKWGRYGSALKPTGIEPLLLGAGCILVLESRSQSETIQLVFLRWTLVSGYSKDHTGPQTHQVVQYEAETPQWEAPVSVFLISWITQQTPALSCIIVKVQSQSFSTVTVSFHSGSPFSRAVFLPAWVSNSGLNPSSPQPLGLPVKGYRVENIYKFEHNWCNTAVIYGSQQEETMKL